MTTFTITITIITSESTWEEAGLGFRCDGGAGEQYLPSSSRKVENLEACQCACEDNAECQSISFYYKGRWCSQFSTPCTKLKWKHDVISMRLVFTDTTETTEVTTAAITAATTATTTVATTAAKRCGAWCANNKSPWKSKCTWPACNGCSDCGKWYRGVAINAKFSTKLINLT